MLDRRGFVGAALAAGIASRAGASLPYLASDLEILERKHGGRLGVSCLMLERDIVIPFPLIYSDGYPIPEFREVLGFWQHQRFAFCSSFKLSLAALVLDGAEKGEWRLEEKLAYSAADLLPNSPVTQANLALGNMTIEALAEAAQKFSDNAAANILLRKIGGFDRLNQFWWGLGDTVSRLDDYETALNRVPLGSVRNSTTPAAMALNLVKLFYQGALSPAAAAKLKGWMHDTATGAKRLRAGLPADWWAGDKTGTGLPDDIRGTYVDLAWVEPPKLPPFAIAAFYQPPKPTPDGDPNAEAILAEVGRMVAARVIAQAARKPHSAKP
ncbi:class A beta-lactamase [Novosphingobium umbonatum]|nr:class A beta-lactamase [Novosphingobium umbonatum]